MTNSSGRKAVSYLVRCALPSGHSLVKADQNGVNYTFFGSIGLCPEWENGDAHSNERCMTGVSACMMAHVNTAGIHVPLWLDNDSSVNFNGTTAVPIGWGVDRTNYPMQEGTFFGDIISSGQPSYTSSALTAPLAFYCDGAGYPAGASGIVAGRLGASQSGAPYKNPFGNGVLCQNISTNVPQYSSGVTGSCPSGSTANPAGGCPDGYDAMTASSYPWHNSITVWRNNNYTPVFDTGYRYTIAAGSATSLGMDTGGSPVMLQTLSNQTSAVFVFTAANGRWTISPTSSTGMCLDAGAATNGQALALATCSSSSTSQQFTMSPDASTGQFFIKAGNTGRCLQLRNSSASATIPIETDDCNTGSSAQKFAIQAVATVDGTGGTGGITSTGGTTGTGGTTSTGGTTGTGGTGGSSTFASSRTYRMVPQNATGESIDVCGGSQNYGTCVQQYTTGSTNQNQAFYLLADPGISGNVKITMGANQAKCLGANNSGTSNGTTIVIQDCNGSNVQSFTAMSMPTSGVYAFKHAASGRCLNVNGNTTANGAALIIYDCGYTPAANAQFSVQ